MKERSELPIKNSAGFYEIRIESIGGMGANLAGKIIAESAIIKQGFNGANFASYGSEKKGSPVKSYIRFCSPEQEVYVNSPVEEPHLLVLFHEKFLKEEYALGGLSKDSTLLVNTAKTPEEVRDIAKIPEGKVAVIDAMKIAVEEKVKLNTPMMGAICKVSGFLDPDSLKETIAEALGKKYPHLVEPNLKAFDRGYNEVVIKELTKNPEYSFIPYKRPNPVWGYETAPIGGVILTPGNSVLKDLSISRSGYIPLWNEDKCIHCALCEITCPDMAIVWRVEEKDGKKQYVMKGINYQYCKGCLKCVEICPTSALTKERDSDEIVKKYGLNYI
jgi:pyruvate ferredoxin oxidoreductase gamma subunit